MSSPEWLDMSAYPDIEPDEVASQALLARLHATFHEPGSDQLPPDAWDEMLRGVGDAHEMGMLPGDGYRDWPGDATETVPWDQHPGAVSADHDAGLHDGDAPQDSPHHAGHDPLDPPANRDHDGGHFHIDESHHDEGFHEDGFHDGLHDGPG
jgi:hypothetical protein